MVSFNPAIPLKSPLAKTPSVNPIYFKSVTTKNNTTLNVADPDFIRALIACMDMSAVMGGAASHFGGPAAFAEINSVIHAMAFKEANDTKKEFYDLYHLVNDAGHCENGIYALKAMYAYADLSLQSLKTFRSIQSKLTGHGESHLFPEGVLLSNGPLGSAVAQAQGLAVADALSKSKRVSVLCVSDGASMEGEAKEAFTSIPGLAKKGKLAPFVCVLSDNNTKLSGRIDQDAFSMQPYFDSLEVQGWKRILVEQGNDLQSVADAYEEAVLSAKNNPQQPVLLHLKTIKGIGTEATAKSNSGGHGFPLKKAEELRAFVEEILKTKNLPNEIEAWVSELESIPKKENNTSNDTKKEKIQVGITNALINKYKEGHPIISVTSDLCGSTGVKGFRNEYPEASLDVGVAESNMISLGAGLSKSGFIPVVDTFAQFATTKGALPTIMSSLSQAPYIGIFSHIGFQDAADGASHQSLSYIAMLSSIPNVKTFALSCSSEAEALLGQAIEEFSQLRKVGKTPKTYIFFLGRENFPQSFKEKTSYKLGKSQIIFDNSDMFKKNITIVSVGSMLPEVLAAAKDLEKDEIGLSILNASCLNEPDLDTLNPYLQKTSNRLAIVEEHQKIGGYASILMQALCEAGIKCDTKVFAVPMTFGQSAYKAKHLYDKFGLGAESIAQNIREHLMKD